MANRPASAITQLLGAAGQGDAAAVNRLWSAVHEELHRLAQAQLAREGSSWGRRPGIPSLRGRGAWALAEDDLLDIGTDRAAGPRRLECRRGTEASAAY